MSSSPEKVEPENNEEDELSPEEKQRQYNREYYRKNRERILAQKKRRYENDPEYREQINEARNKQLEKEKRERRIKRLKNGKVSRVERPPKPMKVELPDGSTVAVPMFKRGQFAHRLGLSSQTLAKWETENILPEALYRTKGGHRLYTEDQVRAVKAVYLKHNRSDGPWRLTDEFVSDLHEAWNSLFGGVNRDSEDTD